jgi:hypothetical protein
MWITTDVAARIVGVCNDAFRYHLRKGHFKGAKKVGWAWLIPTNSKGFKTWFGLQSEEVEQAAKQIEKGQY